MNLAGYSTLTYRAVSSADYTALGAPAGLLVAVWITDGQVATVKVTANAGITFIAEIPACGKPYWLPEPVPVPAEAAVGAGGAGSKVHCVVAS